MPGLEAHVLTQAIASIRANGYWVSSIMGQERGTVLAQLKEATGIPSLEYVFGGDDVFLDPKRWGRDEIEWRRFVAAHANDVAETPVGYVTRAEK